MELSSSDDSKKDETMKKTFESSSDSEETTVKKKKAPKKALFLPVEKQEETKPERADSSKQIETEETPVKSAFQEIMEQDNSQNIETEPPLESLNVEEKSAVAEVIIDNNLESAAQELVESEQGSIAEAEAVASVAFLEALSDKVQVGVEVNEATVEEVAAEVIDGLGSEDEEASLEDDDSVDLAEAEIIEAEEVDSDEDDPATTSSTATVSGVSSTTPPVPPASIPPTPPIPPVGVGGSAGGPVSPVPPSGGAGSAPIGPNIAPPNSGNTSGIEQNSDDEFQRRRRRAGDMLLGGIIGYMIGRRRGRINTEKRLMPVQEKLEKEVKQLQQTIATQELQVRKAAAVRYEKQVMIVKTSEKEPTIDTLRKKYDRSEKTDSKTNPKTEVVHNTPAEQSEKQEIAAQPHPENTIVVERGNTTPEKRAPRKKSIETMSLPLLLQIAEDIELDNISLRSMYEKGAIDQKHLREMLKKYMNGEPIEKLWPEVFAERIEGSEQKQEKSLEQSKDDSATSLQGQSNGSGATEPASINLAEPGHYTRPDVPVSPVIQSILNDMERPEKPASKAVPSVALLVLSVIAAIVIISLFA